MAKEIGVRSLILGISLLFPVQGCSFYLLFHSPDESDSVLEMIEEERKSQEEFHSRETEE